MQDRAITEWKAAMVRREQEHDEWKRNQACHFVFLFWLYISGAAAVFVVLSTEGFRYWLSVH